VERTANRPIPSGAVSAKQALGFLVIQALVGLIVLLQFNAYTIWLGIASLAIVAAYPFMKRITSWPQFVLGLAFSWGALVGWSAQFGALSAAPLLLYAASIVWTIGYDTIYAHQDKEDDAIIGVRSTALLFGERTKLMVGLFYAAAIFLLGSAISLAGGGVVAAAGLLLAAIHMAWQIVTLDIDNAENCLQRFRANRTTGWIIFIALVLEALSL
jgi:4-hydroxybenzoate polyprenyltransferase